MRQILTLMFSLAFTGVCLWSARRFLRQGHLLLGGEWVLLGLSALNVLLAAFCQWPSAFALWHFFDVFSRLLGVPLLGGLGLLRVTHGLRLSYRAELVLFGGCVVAGAWLASHDAWSSSIEWAAMLAGGAFLVLTGELARQCATHGLPGHAMLLLKAMIINLVLMLAQADVMSLDPVDHMPLHLDEFIAVYVAWGFAFTELCLACCALAQLKAGRGAGQGGTGQAMVEGR